jgi:hypothetical protein
VRWPRIVLGALGAIATAAALAVETPQVYTFTGLAGLIAFIVAAGCLAADAVPYRPAHLAASAASMVDAVLLVVGARVVGIPVIAPAALLLVLQLAPAARPPSGRWSVRRPG